MTPLALDIAVGAIILLSTLVAYFRGIVKEFFTLAGLALAVFVSYKGGHLLVPGLNKWLGVPLEGSTEKAAPLLGVLTPAVAAKVAAFGGVFLLVFLLMILVGYLITHWIKEAGLSIVDRLLGAGFGFLRGFLLVFLLYVPFTYLVDQKKLPDWAKNSISVPVMQSALAWVNTHAELEKKIEDRGNGIAIKLDKIDIDKIGEDAGQAATELKDEVKKEETAIQKAVPETPPAPVPQSEPPAPVAAPVPVPAPSAPVAPPQPLPLSAPPASNPPPAGVTAP